jgi:hypothetical protein
VGSTPSYLRVSDYNEVFRDFTKSLQATFKIYDNDICSMNDSG